MKLIIVKIIKIKIGLAAKGQIKIGFGKEALKKNRRKSLDLK